MEDWAEVHRLFHREGMAKAAIARRLGMSRNTVDRLLGLREPPRYARTPAGSQLDPFTERIAAMLAEDPTVRATVIRERLRPAGYTGGIRSRTRWIPYVGVSPCEQTWPSGSRRTRQHLFSKGRCLTRLWQRGGPWGELPAMNLAQVTRPETGCDTR